MKWGFKSVPMSIFLQMVQHKAKATTFVFFVNEIKIHEHTNYDYHKISLWNKTKELIFITKVLLERISFNRRSRRSAIHQPPTLHVHNFILSSKLFVIKTRKRFTVKYSTASVKIVKKINIIFIEETSKRF